MKIVLRSLLLYFVSSLSIISTFIRGKPFPALLLEVDRDLLSAECGDVVDKKTSSCGQPPFPHHRCAELSLR